MVKYVAYTPSENEYSQQADLTFIKKQAINGDIVKTYVGSGKLKLALNYTIRNGCVLIVPILNHLGDTPKDIIRIYEKLGSDKIICCDCRVLTPEIIPVLFEHVQMIDEWRITFMREVTRIRRKKGYALGNPRWAEFLTIDAQKKGAQVNKIKSINHPANKKAIPEIIRLRKLGMTGQEIADSLNNQGLRTSTGKRWIASSVLRLLKRNK